MWLGGWRAGRPTAGDTVCVLYNILYCLVWLNANLIDPLYAMLMLLSHVENEPSLS